MKKLCRCSAILLCTVLLANSQTTTSFALSLGHPSLTNDIKEDIDSEIKQDLEDAKDTIDSIKSDYDSDSNESYVAPEDAIAGAEIATAVVGTAAIVTVSKAVTGSSQPINAVKLGGETIYLESTIDDLNKEIASYNQEKHQQNLNKKTQNNADKVKSSPKITSASQPTLREEVEKKMSQKQPEEIAVTDNKKPTKTITEPQTPKSAASVNVDDVLPSPVFPLICLAGFIILLFILGKLKLIK